MEQTAFPGSDPAMTVSAFAALGSEQRLGALGARSGVPGSPLTHHMKILTLAGLVRQEWRGRSIICAAVAYEELRTLSEFRLRECCADSTARCEAHDHG